MLRYIPDPTSESSAGLGFTSRWLRGGGGAELNVTVALSRLGWGGRAKWVSVVPTGILGDDFLKLLGQAYPDGVGAENLSLVRREDGDLGIYHVWPKEHKLVYQRHRSVFGLMDPSWFGEDFWKQLLGSNDDASLHVLHLTGITAQITPNTHKAWWKALSAARTIKEQTAKQAGGPRVMVTMDLNHRPALGSWQDLWLVTEPHIGTLDLLVLSIGDLVRIGETLHVKEAEAIKDLKVPEGLEGAVDLDAALQKALRAVQKRLGSRANLALTCKQRERGSEDPPLQLRWSMVCLRSGTLVSTFPSAVRQRPVEEIGGGDSWLSGVIDGLAGLPGPAAAAPDWSEEVWLAALQRGDVLAALKQQVIGDFSHVERPLLEATLAEHKASRGAVVL